MTLDDDLEQRGFYRLLTSADYITDYARAVTTARREWAERNEDLLVRYCRAMVQAINWLLDPDNKEEAITIIAAADGVSAAKAEQIYSDAIDPVFGFIPDAKIEPSGIGQIIRIREVMGQMQAPLPSPEEYIEERYYRRAIESLAR